MPTHDERLRKIIERAEISAAKRDKLAAEARRAGLPAAEFRKEALNVWLPIRDAVVQKIDQLHKELKPCGFGVTAAVEGRSENDKPLETLRVQVTLPGGQNPYPLTLTPVAVVPGHISYSGPKGQVVNGNDGHLPLFNASPEKALDLVLGYVEEFVR
jgi:hypothetical protein